MYTKSPMTKLLKKTTIFFHILMARITISCIKQHASNIIIIECDMVE